MSAKTHGKSETKLYKVWGSMKARCQNPNDKSYFLYGARGIKVFGTWNRFEPFCAWAMANGYREGLTLERVDNNSGYSPSNCAWIPKSKQSSNTRRCKLITWRGETRILRDWARKLGLPYCVIQARLKKYGWSIDSAFSRPLATPNRRHVKLIEYNGRTKSIAEWSRSIGISYGSLYSQLYRGATIEQITKRLAEATGKPCATNVEGWRASARMVREPGRGAGAGKFA